MKEDGKGLINWSLVGVVVGVIMLLLFLAGLFQSCGTRKVETQIAKTDVKVDKEVKESGTQSNKVEIYTNTVASEKSDKVDERQEQRITELYNENGVLIKRLTELTNQKSTDKSIKDKSVLESFISFEYKTFVTTYRETITIHTKGKVKASETSNKYFYITIALLGGLVIWLGYKKVRG